MTKLILSLQVGLGILLVVMVVTFKDHSRKVQYEIRALEQATAQPVKEEVPVEPAPVPAGLSGDAARLTREIRKLSAGQLRIEEKIQDVLNTFEWLLVDVDAIKRYTWDTVQVLQTREGAEEVEIPAEYKALFNPDTRETLRKMAAEKGIRLLENRVEIPGVVIQDRALLEFVAVVSGGKEHEAIIALTGNFDRESRKPPEGLAVLINAGVQALGYEKGTPVRASSDGKVIPPSGAPVYVYVEWDDKETGERVRARAEDLVYNIRTQTAMAREKWVFVGSRFEKNWSTGDVVYLAEVTGDVVATYSWPNTIIDNTTSEGSDDINYTCFTPRIPPIGTRIDMVLSKEPLPAKEFPPVGASPGGFEDPGEDDGDK